MKSRPLIIILLETIFITALFLLIPFVCSTTPSDMDLSYDKQSEILNVTITHEVADPNSHYIAGVKICLQESVFKTFNYTSQPTNDTFSYLYNISANTGDKIKVAAYCSIEGEIHEDLVVGASSSLSIPGYSKIGFTTLISALFILGMTILKIRKKT
jgi:desulfoferrodoxin (superoxide reductase-like protein)